MRASPCARRDRIGGCAWPWEWRCLWRRRQRDGIEGWAWPWEWRCLWRRRRCDPQEPFDPQDDPLKWPLDNPLKWPLDDHDPEDPRALLSVSRTGAT